MTNLWVKSTTILSALAKKILYLFKNKIIYNFMIFLATKNGRTTKKFSPSAFGVVVGSGIRNGFMILVSLLEGPGEHGGGRQGCPAAGTDHHPAGGGR